MPVFDQKNDVPFEHYLSRYRMLNPIEIADRCGLAYDQSQQIFSVTLLGTTYRVSFPDAEICVQEDPCGLNVPLCCDSKPAKILLLRYLTEGRFASPLGKYLTYREMPWGEVYNQNFQGRCIKRLAFGFGNRLSAFSKAMEQLGAEKIPMGDIGYEFAFLPELTLRFLLWEGDDEFPPSAQILFSDNFSFAFSAEDMAVVGEVTIDLLKRLANH